MEPLNLVPYRERLRTLLIIYFFSEPYNNALSPSLACSFRSEVKIQKIDFLIRYPSYLGYELLRRYEQNGFPNRDAAESIVRAIFADEEPRLRTDDMKRFFYGAYEELDDIIAFLKSRGLVEMQSQKNSALRDTQKVYYVTHFGVERIQNGLAQVPAAQWYFDRCNLIKTYLGDLSGSELKALQYEIDTYKTTAWHDYIADIEEETKDKFYTLFGYRL
jgi:hypothetical protein